MHNEKTMTATAHRNPSPLPLRTVTALALAAMLGGCASPADTAQLASDAGPATTSVDFPAPEFARWKQGSFPSLEALRSVRKGIARDHVRELLGSPHFSAGLFGTPDWNYLFHFHTGKGDGVMTCQYQVRFTEDARVAGLDWKTADCAALVNPPPVVAVPAPKAQASQAMTLGTDGLFRFGGSAPYDLLPEARARIAELAAEIRRRFTSIDGILVTGHTDRLGSDAHNNALSVARARTVRELLVEAGIAPQRVRTRGDGRRAPIVECEGTQATPELVRCLQPNRRVDVEIFGAN